MNNEQCIIDNIKDINLYYEQQSTINNQRTTILLTLQS